MKRDNDQNKKKKKTCITWINMYANMKQPRPTAQTIDKPCDLSFGQEVMAIVKSIVGAKMKIENALTSGLTSIEISISRYRFLHTPGIIISFNWAPANCEKISRCPILLPMSSSWGNYSAFIQKLSISSKISPKLRRKWWKFIDGRLPWISWSG